MAGKLGVAGADVIHNGVSKSAAELEAAIERGVGLVNVGSLDELQRLHCVSERLARAVSVGLRIDPGLGWKAHFGVRADPDSILTLGRVIEEAELLDLTALHVHVGTGIRHPTEFVRALARACELTRVLRDELGIVVKDLDLGGGFGVPTVKSLTTRELALYRLAGRPPRPPRLDDCASHEDFAQALGRALRRECRRHRLGEPRLRLEPGRALTSSPQVLIVRVLEIKRKKRGACFAIVDGGMQNIAFPLSYEYHHCFVANKGRAASGPATRSPVRFAPRRTSCSGTGRCRAPIRRSAGDINVGAYFTSFANNSPTLAPGRPGLRR